jgi:hypothetical protein
MDEYPELDCNFPTGAEIGDTWICPECARKFHYVLITVEDTGCAYEAWYTDEIGF